MTYKLDEEQILKDIGDMVVYTFPEHLPPNNVLDIENVECLNALIKYIQNIAAVSYIYGHKEGIEKGRKL